MKNLINPGPSLGSVQASYETAVESRGLQKERKKEIEILSESSEDKTIDPDDPLDITVHGNIQEHTATIILIFFHRKRINTKL